MESVLEDVIDLTAETVVDTAIERIKAADIFIVVAANKTEDGEFTNITSTQKASSFDTMYLLDISKQATKERMMEKIAGEPFAGILAALLGGER